MKRNDVDLKLISKVVSACCILHNICKIQKEHFLPEWTVQDIVGQPSEVELDAGLSEGGPASVEVIRETLVANLHSID